MKSLLHTFRARKLLTALVSIALPASSLASAGRVDFAIGQVSSVDKDGKQRRLIKGSRINNGDTITTSRGRAQLRFSDGGYTSLAPNTEFRIDDYTDTQDQSTSRSFFSLLKGGLRTITGAIGKLRKKSYRLTTPVATIGIRGTEFVVLFEGDGLSISVGGGLIIVEVNGVITEYPAGSNVFIPVDGGQPQLADEEISIPPPDEYSVGDDIDKKRELFGPQVGDSGPFFGIAAAYGFDGGEGGVNVDLEGRGSLEEQELVTGVFNAQGGLVAFTFDGPQSGAPLSGAVSGSIAESGIVDGIVGWGRWDRGVVAASPAQPQDTLHYAVGLPAVGVPTTGQADYLFAGGSRPTVISASEGIVLGTISNTTHMKADFGQPVNQLTAHIATTISGSGGNIVSNAVIPLTLGQNADRFVFSGEGSVTGGQCNTCSAFASGLLAGPGASHAGLAYKHGINLGHGDGFEYALGSVAFRKGAAGSAPSLPTPTPDPR